MSRVYIGIDPGLTGAIAYITDGGGYGVYDLPIVSDGTHKWIDSGCLLTIIATIPKGHQSVYVERTHAMPKQGVSSTFAMGMALGSILATCQAAGLSIRMVPAATWKKASKLSSDKSASLGKARLMFPNAELHRKKDHNRAEALLIADWGRLHG
jgi:crossover junction endodeoxyribonuclease RuvC